MAPEHGGALARICRAHGWSYGVVWRVDRLDPRLLSVEDSFCEEEVRGAVAIVLNQVHMVGEGIVGETALSGRYKWIDDDSSIAYLSSVFSSRNPKSSLGKVGWINQYFTGIKTVVIISLGSFGVAQFGSTKKVPESLMFINQAKQQLNSHKDASFSNHHVKLDSTSSSREAYSYYQTNDSFDGSNSASMPGRELLKTVDNSLSTVTRASSDDRFLINNASAYELPTASTSSVMFTEFYNQYQITSFGSKKSTFNSRTHSNAAIAEPDAAVSPTIRSLVSSGGTDSSDIAICITNKNVDASVTGQEMLPCSGLEESSNSLPINSHFPAPYMDSANNVSIHPPSTEFELQDAILDIGTSKVVQGSSSETTLPLPLPFGNPGNINAACNALSRCSDLLYPFGASTQVLAPENSMQVLDDGQGQKGIHLNVEKPERMKNVDVEANENHTAIAISSGLVESYTSCHNMASEECKIEAQNANTILASSVGLGSNRKYKSSKTPDQLLRDNDLFVGMELDPSPFNFVQEYWDDIVIPTSCSSFGICLSEGVSELQMDSPAAVDKGQFSGSDLEQFLDAIVGENIKKNSNQGSTGKGVPIGGLSLENQIFTIPSISDSPMCKNQISSMRIPPICHTSNVLLSHCNHRVIHGSSEKDQIKSSISSRVDDNHSMNTDNNIHNQLKKGQEIKAVKKRARPGESTRPRPKDRQQIQDRVRELREIVPNGAKCSIDALLDRTIKHMLFLQSVTKYADKLKQADEPKIVEESGVVLKDNSGSCSSGGATWAYEVAGQTMVCPIIVEDLTPPGQMLVEMLCDERGFFLEIADIIRGFGLTILKGVMEVRGYKIWARFLVEANKDVTRMDIFLSLVQLLQQTSTNRSNEQATRLIDKGTSLYPNYQQSLMPIQ